MVRVDHFLDRPHAATVPNCTGVIVTGSHPGCGKSSVAFQAAMTATARGGVALVLCSEAALLRKLPRPRSSLEAAAADQLQRIHFAYATSLSQVRRLLATVDCRPSVVLVEDDGLDDAGDALAWLKTLAVLDATVRWLQSAAGGGLTDSCFVFVTNVHGGGRSALPFCQHAAELCVSSPCSFVVRPPFGQPIAVSF